MGTVCLETGKHSAAREFSQDHDLMLSVPQGVALSSSVKDQLGTYDVHKIVFYFQLHCRKDRRLYAKKYDISSVLCSYSKRHCGGNTAIEQTQPFTTSYTHHLQKFIFFQFLKSKNYEKYLARSKRVHRNNHIGFLALLNSIQKKYNLLSAPNHHILYITKWPYAS